LPDTALRNVTCSVTPYHLCFTDNDLQQYDTNLKVYPPLRTADDAIALRNAVKDGTVDCIATHHMPHEYDSKVLEFEFAKFGMTGLETAYPVLKRTLPEINESRLAELLTVSARSIFGLPNCTIDKGSICCMTFFDPTKEWVLNEHEIKSKSRNTAFINQQLTGKSVGIINGNNYFFNLN
jgi:dihydroorotase